jgi:UDP-N-acetylglucosamine 2-epimerase (non-hydrolysing)
MKILHAMGARPNFMKMAPMASTPLSTGLREMAQYPHEFAQILVHTGQHDDASMSQVFFNELDLPR